MEEIIESDVQDVLGNAVAKMVGIGSKSDGAKIKGKNAIYTLHNLKQMLFMYARDDPSESQITVADPFRVSQSQVLPWVKTRIAIIYKDEVISLELAT